MSYINKVLKKFGMHECKPRDTSVAKGDKSNLNKCLEIQEMRKIPYSLVIESLDYAQVCMHLDMAYIVCSNMAYIVGFF